MCKHCASNIAAYRLVTCQTNSYPAVLLCSYRPMRRSRIYTPQILTVTTQIQLQEQASHYVSKVLRLTVADSLCVFNGDGHEYNAVIADIGKKAVMVTLTEQLTPPTESLIYTVLGLGISRGERMDYAIQKSTELGISRIVPLFTEHCEVKLHAERIDKRQQHWQQIAISACEQSGRVKVPMVDKPQHLQAWLDTQTASLKLMFDHSQNAALGGARPAGEIALLIGPEGGLSTAEQSQATKSGFVGIALGNRVLRTETAPVVALSVLQYLWGA